MQPNICVNLTSCVYFGIISNFDIPVVSGVLALVCFSAIQPTIQINRQQPFTNGLLL
jgi:hypothetical protein